MIDETVIDTRKKDKNVVIISENGTVKWRRLKETPCICGSWIAVLLRFVPGMVS